MLMERQVKELTRGPSSIPPSLLTEGRCLLLYLPMDYQQTSHLLPSFFFLLKKHTKYKTFPEILYFPFWFRKFFRFPLANIYIFLLKMLNQEELFSGLPYI